MERTRRLIDRRWATIIVSAIVLSSVGTFFTGYAPDDVAVLVAVPIIVYMLLPHIVVHLLPEPKPDAAGSLKDFLATLPPRERPIILTLTVFAFVFIFAFYLGLVVAISSGVYYLIDLNSAVRPSLNVAAILMSAGLGYFASIRAILEALKMLARGIRLYRDWSRAGRRIHRTAFEWLAWQ